MAINNNVEFDITVTMALTGIVNEILDHAIEDLKEKIKTDVYAKNATMSDSAGEWYTRTYDFLERAWNKSDIEILGNIVNGSIGYEPEEMGMRVSPENFEHGSKFWHTEDIRDELADIIFQGRPSTMFGQILPRDAWSSFLASVDNNLDSWVHTACTHYKLPTSIFSSFIFS